MDNELDSNVIYSFYSRRDKGSWHGKIIINVNLIFNIRGFSHNSN